MGEVAKKILEQLSEAITHKVIWPDDESYYLAIRLHRRLRMAAEKEDEDGGTASHPYDSRGGCD